VSGPLKPYTTGDFVRAIGMAFFLATIATLIPGKWVEVYFFIVILLYELIFRREAVE